MQFAAFEKLHTPIWIYDLQNRHVVWANLSALQLWQVTSLQELTQQRGKSPVTLPRHPDDYRDQFHVNQTIQELWTLHPVGQSPLVVQCSSSSWCLEDGRLGILVEGHGPQTQCSEVDGLRSAAALQQATCLISLFTLTGEMLLQSSAAIACYGEGASFSARFQDLQVGCQALQALATELSWQAECRVNTRRGPRWHALGLSKIQDPVTGGAALLLHETDITQRKALERKHQQLFETLEETAERYETALQGLNEGVLMLRADGQVIACNASAQALLGLPPPPSQDPAALDRCWQAVREAGAPLPKAEHPVMLTLQTGISHHRVIIGIQKPDGSRAWLSVNTQPVWRADSDCPYAVVASFSDVTARKQAEAHLRQQTEMLQAIVDHMPIMLAFSNAQGQIQFINRSLETVLGWSLADWQQRNIWAECYPSAPQRARALEHIQEASGTWQDFSICTAQGQTLDTAWANIRLSDGQLISIGQDISPRKQTEKALQQQAHRDHLMMQMAQRIAQALELQDIFGIAVTEMRQLLETHRVFICRLEQPQQPGTILAESVVAPYRPFQEIETFPLCYLMAQHYCCLMAPTLSPKAIASGYSQRISDICSAGLPAAALQALQEFSIRAFVSVPIFQQDRLWGMLVAQHCKEPRVWQDTEVHTMQQLADQLAIAIQQTSLYQQLQEVNRELQHIATHDKLTGLANRRQFDTYLHQEWQRHAREIAPLAMILGDIDHFKLYNDTFGHPAGDDCLVQVAQAISRAVKRPTDLVARYGGEEFAIILPNTDLAGATQLAEHIRQEVNRRGIPHFSSLVKPQITLSLGIACVYPSFSLVPEQFVAMTDLALYEAKQSGRDRYCIAR